MKSSQLQMKSLNGRLCLIFNKKGLSRCYFLVIIIIIIIIILVIFYWLHCTKINFGLADFLLTPCPLSFSLPEPTFFLLMLFPIMPAPFFPKFFSWTVMSNFSLFLLMLCTHSIWKWNSISFSLLFLICILKKSIEKLYY